MARVESEDQFKRLTALRLMAKGWNTKTIAEKLDYCERHVAQIRRDWWTHGWAGVIAMRGDPIVVDERVIQDLIREYLWGPPYTNYRYPQDHPLRHEWTGSAIRTYVKHRTGQEIGPRRRASLLKGLKQLKAAFNEEQLQQLYGPYRQVTRKLPASWLRSLKPD